MRTWHETLDAYQRHTSDEEDQPHWNGFDDALRTEENAWRRERASRTRRRLTAAAALVATLLGGWLWQRHAEVVLSAQEVLTRAVASERERSSPDANLVRVIVAPRSAEAHQRRSTVPARRTSEVAPNQSEIRRELAARLAPYGFDWTAPLSAKHFQRWRVTADAAQDHLLRVDATLLKLSTVVEEGTIRQAEITVRQDTYESVAQNWRFADGFEVELTIRAEEPATEAPTTLVEVIREATTATPVASPSVDLEEIELDVRRALHEFGAASGRELTIRHGRGRVLVTGAVLSAETARQIRDYASARRFVDARIEVGPAPAARDVDNVPAALRAWLDRALPDGELRTTFINHTWELHDRIMRTASALDELATRYSSEATLVLSPEAKRKLQDLVAAEYSDLTGGYQALERQLAPLVGTVSRPVMPTSPPSDWRRVSKSSRESVARLTSGVESIFTDDGSAPTDDVVHTARLTLRPALEALGNGIAGLP